MTDIKKLRELAEKATPGPWEASGNLPFYATLKKPARSLSKHDDKRPDYWRVQDVEFVLAANPDTVIALIDELEAARKLAQYYAVHWDNCPKQKALDVKCTCGVEALLEKVTHE